MPWSIISKKPCDSRALESHGFFEIIDHGISRDSLDKSYYLAAKFFNLSHEIKNKYSHPEFGGARGYTQYGKETALGETTPDQKEFWHHGPDIDASISGPWCQNSFWSGVVSPNAVSLPYWV